MPRFQVFVLMQFDPGLEYKPQSRPNAQNTGGAVGMYKHALMREAYN